MPNNNHDDFEDIYSNTPTKPKFEVDIPDDDYGDVSSFSEDYGKTAQVKYNSSADNRRRQEYSFDDSDKVYENMIPEEPKRSGKKRPGLKVVAVLLVLVLLFTGVGGVYAYSSVKNLVDSITPGEALQENIYISSSELYSDKEQINILLVGTDAREQNVNSRSDTMMLLTIDYKNNQIKLTSFLRDSYVQIAREGLRKEKLNAAFFRGGIQMLVDTLELNFKIDIPYYAIVDFEIFEKIIDTLGGIDVEVTAKESNFINNKENMSAHDRTYFPQNIEEGVNHFSGGQALYYSRIRYLDSDFMRTQRQRKVMSAIMSEFKTMSPREMLSMANDILPMLSTNIPSDEIMSLGFNALKNKAFKFDVCQHSIPADGTWTNKRISGVGDCLVIDFDANIKSLHDFLKNSQSSEK